MASKRKWKKSGEEEAEGSRRAKSANTSDEALTVCEISKNRKVVVKKWSGKVLIDIREYYSKDNESMPGKKGISLTLEQWNVLQQNIEAIDAAIAGT